VTEDDRVAGTEVKLRSEQRADRDPRRAGRTPQEATTIAVRLAPATSVTVAKRRLTSALSGVTVISDPSEAVRAGANTELISKAVCC